MFHMLHPEFRKQGYIRFSSLISESSQKASMIGQIDTLLVVSY